MKYEPLIIPHDQLSAEALQALIEEFVSRDGTDYGEQEPSMETRVAQVRNSLERGHAVILFDRADGSITIVRRDLLQAE